MHPKELAELERRFNNRFQQRFGIYPQTKYSIDEMERFIKEPFSRFK